ncbi:GMC oxidoreductase-domain-containing protein [Hypoxylon trugodes]|uniref:GMC oxidoreductase-domain-containing protein n=1 Tax=Hypoxylon trugodes TaxID=326681 RepID=UPI0021A08E60|nr:GMC oxidoreductase-domain-containing protein [Hypoxylon trugodes]KAI1394367.1 GMC oxidoreductase-domain-containing protein [Hypoxylon trugodes]
MQPAPRASQVDGLTSLSFPLHCTAKHGEPVLATRLSELSTIQVLVIEAGEDLMKDARVIIPALAPTLTGTSADWATQTSSQLTFSQSQASLRGRQLFHPLGRTLGGSSALNSHTFTPTSKANVDAWASLGNDGWDWESFSKSIDNSYTLAKSPWKTEARGPLQLSVADEETRWPQVWREAISKLGYPVSGNPFSGQFQGALVTPESIDPDTKERSFAGSAYLSLAQSRQNLTIWTQASVDKVLFNKPIDQGDPVATGVQITRDGKTEVVRARKEVIISAGALHSPKILELSGIGDATLLRSLGIDVIVDNPHVGENLQNHPICSVTFQVSPQDGFQTIDSLVRQDPDTLASAMEAYGKDRTGPFARSGIDLMAQLPLPNLEGPKGSRELDLVLHDPKYEDRDLGKTTTAFAEAHRSFVNSILASPTGRSAEYITCPGYAVYGPDGKMTAIPPGTERYFSAAVFLSLPLSRGSVHITSSGLDIDPKYFSHPLDAEMLARHVQQLETIMNTDPFPKHLKLDGVRNPVVPPPGSLSDLDNARAFVLSSTAAAHHFTGACSMMPRETGGVVDAQLRVYGCRNLRVRDASIILIIPGASPQATVYGVAEHGARIIKSAL